jgi:hypothetical protein
MTEKVKNGVLITSTGRALSKPVEFQEFIIWTATPEPLRELKTQQEFAEKFKVSEQTLSAWRKRDDFWDEVKKEWDKWGKEKTNNVIARFYQRIISPDATTADFKLWFQFFLDWKEKTEVEHHAELKIQQIKELMIFVKTIPEEAFLEYFKQGNDKPNLEPAGSPAEQDKTIP